MSAVPTNPTSPALTRAQIEAVLTGFSGADWERARSIAGGLCGGLTGWSADDLLQEAITKFLEGARSWPANVHPLVVLKNVMHSIASNERKHNKASPVDDRVEVDPFETSDDEQRAAAKSHTGITPEDQVAGKQEMAALYAALGGDEDLEMLAMAWADGMRGEDARNELGWDEKKYDANRSRLKRRLKKLDPERSER
jgi:DNA-directed RNA polymerase specialized sigma24 family protein